MSTETPDDPLWPAGYRRIVLDEVDSTMAEAARRAPGLTEPTWILARTQTAARGRRGRAWVNSEGNFAATLLIRPDGPASDAALRSFVAAVALYWTLSLMVDRARLSQKWPNDVLLDGGKVAGILLESSGRGNSVDWLSIGVGINLVNSPDPAMLEAGAVRPVSVAGQGGSAMTPEDTLSHLADHFDRHEGLFRKLGFDPIRRLWLRHAAKLGEVITARTGAETITGTFDTVDNSGALVLTTPKGRRAIPAADVYF